MGSLKCFFPGSVEENGEILLKLVIKLGAFKTRQLSDFKLLGESARIKAPFLGEGACRSFFIELMDEDLQATSGPCRIVAEGIAQDGNALPDRRLDAVYGIEGDKLCIRHESERSEITATLWKISDQKSKLEIQYRKRGADKPRMKKVTVVLQLKS